MNKTHLLTLSFILILGNLHAQTSDRETHWTFRTGYENTRLLDKQNSPLIYSAHSAVIGSSFTRSKPQSVSGISLTTSIGSSQSKRFGQRSAELEDPYDIYGNREVYNVLGNPALSYIHLSLAYTYQRRFTLTARDYFIGAQLGNDFFMSGIGLDTWFFNSLSFSPVLSTKFVLNGDSHIPVRLSFPLVSYIVREPFGKDPSIPLDNYLEANMKTGGAIASLNKYQKVAFTAGYRRDWKSKWTLGLDYTFYWYHYSDPDDLRAYSNQLTLMLIKTR